MSRNRDEARRLAILGSAKRMFAGIGYAATSVALLAADAHVPVGSVYTYFTSKDDILATIIEEGWTGFAAGLTAGLSFCPDPVGKVAFLVRTALPSLFADVEFIDIFLKEAVGLAGLDSKLDFLTGIISGVLEELTAMRRDHLPQDGQRVFSHRQVRAALAVFFLGSLDTVRLSVRAAIRVSVGDVTDFIVSAIENSYGITLPGADLRPEGGL